ncbi:MAG: S8 family serine peptidase [Candidatus Sericytochromatia bacterium]|nr:S8 family serine peptidase [Candidatus Sericytochromatia bacterium]
MQIKYVFHTLLAGLLILSACQMQTPSTSGIKTNTANLNSPAQMAFNQRKGPYTGPVSIKINTGLMQQSTGKVVEIKSQDNFKIQAVPQGPVVFSETLQINRPNQDFMRLFKVPNTGKRYIVHVAKQEPQQGCDSRVQVNLNGAWVIREKDFERGEEEFQTTGLLLNANNSLKIRFKGKTGNHLTLTVVEAGEAGTVLRRRGWEKDKDLTQADRIRNNDTNIFDPNQPDSLGELQPYEGDELLNPDNPNSSKIGVSTANGSQATIFVGEFYVTLAEPVEENLQYLLANYPIELTERYILGEHTEAIFKIKMDQASLQNLPETIAALNLRPGFLALEEVVFSSVNTAKTVAVLSEILAHESERLVYIGLQNKAEKHFQNSNGKIVTEEENRSAIYSPAGFTQPIKSSDLWWIEKTKANQAWQYGLGHGVKVAIIDDEFGLIQEYTDFKNRVDTIQYLKVPSYDDQGLNPTLPTKLLIEPGHGLVTANILGARSGDKFGIAGIAPQSILVPMASNGKIDTYIVEQLDKIANGNNIADVVNISQGRSANFYDYWTNKTSNGNTDTAIIKRYKQVFNRLNQKNIFVVTSGGNENKQNGEFDSAQPTILKGNFPSTLSVDSPNVFSVGAFDKNNNRAFFTNPNPPIYVASNFGAPGIITIWAPGKDINTIDWFFNGDQNTNIFLNYTELFSKESGTSQAAPQVAGALALLKGWKKNLTGSEAKAILNDTAMSITEPANTPANKSFYPLSTLRPVTVKGLDVLAAIKHPSINAKPYQTYTGTAQANGTVLINGSTYTTKPNYLDLDPTLQVGDTVTLSGWLQADNPNIPANEIHLLGLVKGTILQPIQSLPTHSALAVKAFTINQQHYLAVANFYNGSSHQIASDIYRFNNNPNQPQYLLDHSLSSSGAYDVEPFKIGNDTFLALINHVGGNSKIFKWDAGQNKFLEFQSLPTFGGTDAEHFEFNGEHYLAIANLWLGTPTLESAIFKWNGTTFVKHQGISTTGAFRWKAFQIGNNAFLALASYAAYYGGNPNTLSRVFKKIGNDFVPIQDIPTLNAYDWEAFSIGNDHYLAVANYGSGEIISSGDNQVDRRATSSIYRWNGSQFQEFQPIATNGATSWKHFEVNGTHYLILSSDEQFSYIYRWNGSAFEVFRSIASNGNIDWEFASVGNNLYLIAVANYFGSQGYNTPSNVYKFEP